MEVFHTTVFKKIINKTFEYKKDEIINTIELLIFLFIDFMYYFSDFLIVFCLYVCSF